MAVTVPVEFDAKGDGLERDIDRAVKKSTSTAEQEFARGGKRAGSLFSKGAIAGFAAIGGAAVIKDFVGGSIAEAREAAKVGALTENVIKQTGGAAKITAEQVGELSTAISNKVGIDDEAIQSGANLLLTFKNVRNEVGEGADIFNRATAAAVDLSASGFGDLKGASLQLGKALNDPVKGIAALGRAGVTFSTQQKAAIKALVEGGDANAAVALDLIGSTTAYNALLKENKGDVLATAKALTNGLSPAQKELFERYSEGNDILGAQQIILKEVESQVGGSAAAQVNAADKAAVAFGNLKEEIGTALLPVVDDLANKVTNDVIPAVSELVQEFQDGTGTGGEIRDVLEDVGDALEIVFNIGSSVVGVFSDLPGPVKSSVVQLGLAYIALRQIQRISGPAALGVSSFVTSMRNVDDRTKLTKRSLQGLGSGLRDVGGAGGLLLVADASNRSSEALSGLQAAAGGALSGAALGAFAGPPGAAVGAAVGGLAGLAFGLTRNVDDSGEAAKIATPRFDDYAEAINAGKDATKALIKETAEFNLRESGALDAARQLGVDTASVVRAALGDAKEIERINKVITQALSVDYTDKNARILLAAIEQNAAAIKRQKIQVNEALLAQGKYNRVLKDVPKNVQTEIDTIGLAKSEADIVRLTKKYNLTPKQVETVLRAAGVPDAVKAAQTVTEAVRKVPNSKTITFRVNSKALNNITPGLSSLVIGGAGNAGRSRPRAIAPAPTTAEGAVQFNQRPVLDQPEPVSTVINQNYYGPTTGRERLAEIEWSQRYATRARGAA